MNWYILDDENNPVLSTMEEYVNWRTNNLKRVNILNSEFGESRISTVFLGLDHAFISGLHDPVLWETMIFGGKHDMTCERYSSLELAIKGHKKLLNLEMKEKQKTRKTFVMGDIHGNYRGLLQCLERSGFDKENDILIQLGDIADGWPEVPECVDELLTIKHLIPIRGNHDVWCYDWFNKGEKPILWTEQGGKATIEAYIRTGQLKSPLHAAFWNNQLDWYEDEERRLFIHAGYAYRETYFPESAELDVNAGSIAKECHWDRTLLEGAASASKGGKDNDAVFNATSMFKEVYIGHTATRDSLPLQLCNVHDIDTGSGWYGKLTIMDINTKEYWQSDFATLLYPEHKGRG